MSDDTGNLDGTVTAARTALDASSISESQDCGEQNIPDQAYLDRILDLSMALSSRYDRFGSYEDLQESFALELKVVKMLPEHHADRPLYLHNLSQTLLSAHADRFTISWDEYPQSNTLEMAVSFSRLAVNSAGPNHTSLPLYCHGLSGALTTRFQDRDNGQDDIDDAVAASYSAVISMSDDLQTHATYCLGLTRALSARFTRFGDQFDLEQAIDFSRIAYEAFDSPSTLRSAAASTLGKELMSRYGYAGDPQDMEEAIEVLSRAVAETPDDHPSCQSRHLNLGSALMSQYERYGDRVHASHALDHLIAARDGRNERISLLAFSSLGALHQTLYENGSGEDNAVEAVQCARNALKLLEAGSHPSSESVFYQDRLSDTLLTLYDSAKQEKWLHEAIEHSSGVVVVCLEDRPERSSYLATLGLTYYMRSQTASADAEDDLSKSVKYLRESMTAMDPHHSRFPQVSTNFARALLALDNTRHAIKTDTDSLTGEALIEEAYGHYRRTVSSMTTPPLVRMDAAQQWATHAQATSRISIALEAYQLALDLIPEALWIGVDFTTRVQAASRVTKLAGDAAACAISSGNLPLAIEWLERGRSILWQEFYQTSRQRVDLNALRRVDEALADQISTSAEMIENGSMRRNQRGFNILDEDGSPTVGVMDDVSRGQRDAAKEWPVLLGQARKFPGFERFLLPLCFDDLSQAARSGPVVLLNGTQFRCDALILLPGSVDVRLVEIQASYDAVSAIARKFVQIDKLPGRGSRPHRRPGFNPEDELRRVFEFCWIHVVQPLVRVLDEIQPISPRTKRRIWWCCSGPFTSLPLHAAGIYAENSHVQSMSNAMDLLISSYAPTLATLLPKPTHQRTMSPAILVVAVPNAPNASSIPNTLTELRLIKEIVPNSTPLLSLESSEAMISAFTSALQSHSFVHLACHGRQNALQQDVLKSALMLHDRALELSELIQTPIPHAEFAFLSACESATGETMLMDEGLHLAGGMLFMGFRGVVATLWGVWDRDGPVVARAFYERLFELSSSNSKKEGDADASSTFNDADSEGKGGHNGALDGTLAAEALNDAVRVLRDSGVSLLRWVPFVHLGV